MRAIFFLLATCLAVASVHVDAKGRRSSSGGAKSQYVHGYTKASQRQARRLASIPMS
jgi:hypothetical protein